MDQQAESRLLRPLPSIDPQAGERKPPRVSVVIPAFNRGDLLIEALESVLAQSYRDYEIIVVDDGSTDQTARLIEPYLDRLTYLWQPNQGVAHARNTGILKARGELICFLDSDDLWTPGKISSQVRFADEHPNYGLVAAEIAAFDAQGDYAHRAKASLYRIRNGFVLEHLLFSNWIQTSTVMVRRECLEKVGLFDEDVGQFGEDWLLWMRVAAEFPVYFLPEPLVRYRIHPQSLMSHQPEAQYESLMLILDKLRELPKFRDRQHLIERAGYRISLNRGRGNLRAGNYRQAEGKLRQACSMSRMPVKAAGLLLLAQLGSAFRGATDGARA